MLGIVKLLVLGPPFLLYLLLGSLGLPWFIRVPVLIVMSSIWIIGVMLLVFS